MARPVTGGVRVAVDGEETAAFTIEPGWWIALGAAPAVGAVVTAGFAFDVPVRFAGDHLSVTRATFLAGEAPSVALIELPAALDGGLYRRSHNAPEGRARCNHGTHATRPAKYK